MHQYIDLLDFEDMGLDEGVRKLCSYFKLPGEGQKIDRIMEKFADRYCELNPTVFAKADIAYILAFSTIMLNTDQHSSQIKHRMDKAAFIKNNRGINDNDDLPEEFLGAIFDEISQNETPDFYGPYLITHTPAAPARPCDVDAFPFPPPPPPSSAKQGVPERVVSRVKNAVAVLTRRGGVRG